MDLILAVAVGACWLLVPLALALPRLRVIAVASLAGAVVLSLGAALSSPGLRELTIEHTFSAYFELDVVARPFVVDHAVAPGWQWPLPFLAYALLWAAGLLASHRRGPAGAFVLPWLAATSALVCWLAMQLLAAPAAIVQPFAEDRFLFPAGLAMALLAARQVQRFWSLLFSLSLGIVAMRLPLALLSKLASDRHLGTSLDIHTITAFVVPISHQDLEVAPGSFAQQEWLIWAPHVLFFPAFYLLSLGGVAFAAFLFHRHPPGAE